MIQRRRAITDVRVAGIACAAPGRPLPLDVAAPNVAKMAQSTGVAARHVAPVGVCASDLCEAAAVPLIGSLGWSPESIDALIFVSQTPDAILPATACILHGKLGLAPGCAAFDVNLGCSGYVYGLHLAASLIAARQAHRVLLLVGDTISKVISPADRSVAYLFGDAGSATAVEYTDGAAPMSFVLGTDGTGARHLQIPAGGFRRPRSPETAVVLEEGNGNARSAEHLYMNGAEIFNFTLSRVPALVQAVTADAGWAIADVDAWVFHQANRFMIDHLVKRMKVPRERVLVEMGRVGNTSSASIPLAIVTGARDSLASASQKCVLAGFGVGFSWGGAALQTDRPLVLPLIEYTAC